MLRLAVVAVLLAGAAPAGAAWGNICGVAFQRSAADFFGPKSGEPVDGPSSCREPLVKGDPEDYSMYGMAAVYRNGTRLRPTTAYTYYRRGAATKLATFLPFPVGYTARSTATTYRCAGESAKGPVPPTWCSRGSRGLLRSDTTFGNKGTPYVQVVLVTKYRAGIAQRDGSYDIGHITTAAPAGATFASGWEEDELAALLARCLPVGAKCGY